MMHSQNTETSKSEKTDVDHLSNLKRYLYFTWFEFAVKYRRTALGPLWILVGPSLFICTLGVLFSYVNKSTPDEFIPHLATGLVSWTLISGFVTNSTKVFHRSRAQILQGNMSLIDIALVDIFSTTLQFFHQILILAVVIIWFGIDISAYFLISLIGVGLLLINGLWLTVLFGIIGARYRDLSEIVAAIMRIAFLATPIIWIPGVGDRGQVISTFLEFNPFFHFVEFIRAPLLGNPLSLTSILVVLIITIVGSSLAFHFYWRFAKKIPLWI